MNERQALAAVESILGGAAGQGGTMQKQASAPSAAASARKEDILKNLGRTKLAEIYQGAHEKIAAVQIDSALEKVATLIIADAARRGTLGGFVKQACAGDADLAEVTAQVIVNSLQQG